MSRAFKAAIRGLFVGCLIGVILELMIPDPKRRHEAMPAFCGLIGLLLSLLIQALRRRSRTPETPSP
jgi:hypothetical protein